MFVPGSTGESVLQSAYISCLCRYDYNKYLQYAAADRIEREGLNNARQE